MDFKEIQSNLIGKWTGKNILRLSSLAPKDYSSSSHLSITQVAKDKVLMFTYTWNHESTLQEGTLLVGYNKKQNIVTAAWVDSWHMGSEVMFCNGTINTQGIINLRRSYKAPPGPDWGWHIIITTPSDNQLQIVMYNCTPEGEEELAVQADYQRLARS